MAGTYGKRFLNRPLRRDDGDALDVEPVFARASERQASRVRITRELERGEEQRIALDRVVAKCPGVHGDKLALACVLGVHS